MPRAQRTTTKMRVLRTANRARGAALLLTFIMMLVVSGLALGTGIFAQNSVVAGRTYAIDRQTMYIAEAGWQRARQALVAGTWAAAASPGNAYTESFGAGEYIVTVVDNGGGSYTVTSEGYVPNHTTFVAQRKMVEDQFSVTFTDGINFSLTATASASSSQGGNPASYANDGDTSTKWQSNVAGSGSWLEMDYGSAKSLNKIVVKEDSNITGVSIEWSDNNSSWTTASGLSVIESPSKTWTANFTAASHRYFHAVFTSPSNKKAGVKEMESYSSVISSLGTGAVTTQW